MRASSSPILLCASVALGASLSESDTYVTLALESSNKQLDGELLDHGFELRKLERVVGVLSAQSVEDVSYALSGDGNLIWSGWMLNVRHQTLETTFLAAPGVSPLVENGYLTVNGSSNHFFVCTPPPETINPNNLPVQQAYRGIGVFGDSEPVPSQCEQVRIKALSTSASAVTTSTTDAAATTKWSTSQGVTITGNSATSTFSSNVAFIAETGSALSSSSRVVSDKSSTTSALYAGSSYTTPMPERNESSPVSSRSAEGSVTMGSTAAPTVALTNAAMSRHLSLSHFAAGAVAAVSLLYF